MRSKALNGHSTSTTMVSHFGGYQWCIVLFVCLRMYSAHNKYDSHRRGTWYACKPFDGISCGLAESRGGWKNDGLAATQTPRRKGGKTRRPRRRACMDRR